MTSESENWIVKQREERKTKESTRKNKGNNWVGVFDFFPSEGDRKKSKTPTWSDEERGAEHIKNSCMQVQVVTRKFSTHRKIFFY